MILIGLSVLQLLNSSQTFHLVSSQTSVCKKMGLEMGSMDRFSKKFYLEKNLNILIVLILNHYNFLAIEQVFSRKCSNKCDDLRWNDMGQGNEECI